MNANKILMLNVLEFDTVVEHVQKVPLLVPEIGQEFSILQQIRKPCLRKDTVVFGVR